MSAFLDASVIVAIVTLESDAESQAARVNEIKGPIYVSSLVLYEATSGVVGKKAKAAAGARATATLVSEAREAVEAFVAEIGAVEVPLVGEIAAMALDACGRFGKVVGHPARLNMGDCFAYACARSKGVPLLFKGDDFSKTDIATA